MTFVARRRKLIPPMILIPQEGSDTKRTRVSQALAVECLESSNVDTIIKPRNSATSVEMGSSRAHF